MGFVGIKQGVREVFEEKKNNLFTTQYESDSSSFSF